MFWVFILICLMLLLGRGQKSANMGKEAEYTYSDLFDKVQNGQVQDATIQGNELHGHLKAAPKDQFHTTLPPTTRILKRPCWPPRSTSPSRSRRATCCCSC